MWSRCEKEKGKYDFSVLDGVVENLLRCGILPWFSVTYGNTLYMTNCYTGAAVGCVPTLYGAGSRWGQTLKGVVNLAQNCGIIRISF